MIAAVGVLLLVGAAAAGRRVAALAVSGCLLTTLGGMLLLQNALGYHESWANPGRCYPRL